MYLERRRIADNQMSVNPQRQRRTWREGGSDYATTVVHPNNRVPKRRLTLCQVPLGRSSMAGIRCLHRGLERRIESGIVGFRNDIQSAGHLHAFMRHRNIPHRYTRPELDGTERRWTND